MYVDTQPVKRFKRWKNNEIYVGYDVEFGMLPAREHDISLHKSLVTQRIYAVAHLWGNTAVDNTQTWRVDLYDDTTAEQLTRISTPGKLYKIEQMNHENSSKQI